MAAGRMQSFHDLYQKYATDVYRFACWLCGDTQEAEDITSETFVRALAAGSEIRTETVKGYLLTIARNLVYQRQRHAGRVTGLPPALAAAGSSPEQAAEANLSLQDAFQFLQSLPGLERAALLLHSQEEMPYEEIARVLGISAAAARVKVHRARIKLNAYRLKSEGDLP
jgi:RNA polymerase sigma-70 factor, ECF subfamily